MREKVKRSRSRSGNCLMGLFSRFYESFLLEMRFHTSIIDFLDFSQSRIRDISDCVIFV